MKRVAPAACLVALLGASSAAAADPEIREVLSEERYRFCHEDKYPLYPEERAYCPLVGERSEVCPSLPAACKAAIDPEPEAWSFSPRGERRGEPSPSDERRAADKPTAMPTGMSAIAQLLFWGLVVAGVLALIWVIVRNRLRGDEQPEAHEDRRAAAESELDSPAKRVVETDVERLLARARAAAARGDYLEAIDAAYAAALRRLEGEGLIDMHESRTNGDYLRRLRERPELLGPMRDIVRDVERVQFGAAAASAGMFDAVMARVIPVATRLAMLLLFCLLAAQSACDPAERGGGGGSSRGGTSPSGSHAVIELLRKHGVEAGYRIDPLDRLDSEVGVMVVLPGAGPEDGNWEPLFDWVKQGGRLILAGELPPSLDLELVADEGSDTALSPGGVHAYRYHMQGGQMPVGYALRAPDAFEPLLSRHLEAGPHYAVQQGRGQGEIMVFADERMFTNIALAVEHNAELVADLLKDRGKVEIVDPWTQAGAETPLESVHNAGLTALIAQLLLLLLLYLLWRGRIFGTPRDSEQRMRRSFAEHVRAIGTQYARAGAGAHALGVYAGWALERLRERLPKGRQLSIEALAGEVAARTGRDAAEVAALLHEAQAASDQAAPGSYRPESLRALDVMQRAPEQRIQVVHELSALLGAIGGARR